jgi:hypothetical protein
MDWKERLRELVCEHGDFEKACQSVEYMAAVQRLDPIRVVEALETTLNRNRDLPPLDDMSKPDGVMR